MNDGRQLSNGLELSVACRSGFAIVVLPIMCLILTARLLLLSGDTQAQEQSQDQQFKKVATRYQKFLEARPRRGRAVDMLIRHYLDAGKLNELVQHYEAQVKRFPSKVNLRLVLGIVYERRGRDADALAQLVAAEKLEPQNYVPPYYQGIVLSAGHNDDEALKSLRRAIQLSPPAYDTQDILKRIGNIHMRLGDLEKAAASWRQLAERFPTDRFAVEELAELLGSAGKFDEAVQYYRKLQGLAKDRRRKVAAEVEIGQLQIRSGKLKTAIATFEKSLRQVKGDSWLADDIRKRIETVYLKSGDVSGLCDYYGEWLSRHPDDIEATMRHAHFLNRIGRGTDALEQLQGIANRAPGRRDIRLELVKQRVALSDFEAAIQELEELHKGEPQDVAILRELGRLHLRTMETPSEDVQRKAIEAWVKIAEIRPQDASLALQVAELCRDGMGRIARWSNDEDKKENLAQLLKSPLALAALRYYQEATLRAPNVSQYHEFLGEFFHATDRKEAAIASWERMTAPPNDTWQNYRRLAEVYFGRDEQDRAIEAVGKAIDLDEDQFALHALAAHVLAADPVHIDTALAHTEDMLRLADRPYLEERALKERVKILGMGERLGAELQRLDDLIQEGTAQINDYWVAGMIANHQRQGSLAIRYLQGATKLRRNDGRLLRFKAELDEQGGDLLGAAKQWTQLAELEPRNQIAHLRRAVQLLLDLGEYSKATQAVRRMVERSPGNPESHALAADLAFAKGDNEVGLNALRHTVRLAPRERKWRHVLAHRLRLQFKDAEAREHLWRIFDMSDKVADKLAIVAELTHVYSQVGKFPRLVEELNQRRRSAEATYVPTLCLAHAYVTVEEDSLARRELQALLAERPNDLEVLRLLKRLAETSYDLDGAIGYQKQIAEKTKRDGEYRQLASLLAKNGDHKEANEVWSKIGSKAADPWTLVRDAYRFMNQSEYARVEALCQSQLQLRRDDWRFVVPMMLANWYDGDTRRAKRWAEYLLALPPDSTYRDPSGKNKVYSHGHPQPSLIVRLDTARTFDQIITSDPSVRHRNPPDFRPASYADANMLATLIRHKLAKRDETDNWIKHLVKDSETQPAAMQRLAWVYLEAGKPEIFDLCKRWEKERPHDAEPRAIRFQVLLWAPRKGKSWDDNFRELKVLFGWFEKERPQWVSSLGLEYCQALISQRRQDDLEAVAPKVVKATSDPEFLARFADTMQGGPRVYEAATDRLIELNKTKPIEVERALSTYFNALAYTFGDEFDTIASHYARLMNATHPRTLVSFQATSTRGLPVSSVPSVYGSASYQRSSYRTSRYQDDDELDFPKPTSLLARSRLMMTSILLREVGKSQHSQKLFKFIRQEIDRSEGAAKSVWLWVEVIALWETDHVDEALERMKGMESNKILAQELRLLRAQALLSMDRTKETLDVLKGFVVPYGPAAKTVEAMRLACALENDDQVTARTAAARLFGMRLSGHEQIELSKVMRRLGLLSESDTLVGRAKARTGADPAELFDVLMEEVVREDPKAETTANRIFDLTKAHKNEPLRRRTIQLMENVDRLDEMIKAAEAQLAKVPNNTDLLELVADFYAVANRKSDAIDALTRLKKKRSKDHGFNYRIANKLFDQGELEQCFEMLGRIWQDNPAVALSFGEDLLSLYTRGVGIDELGAHLLQLKNRAAIKKLAPELGRLCWNLHTRLEADKSPVVEALCQILPPNQKHHVVANHADLLQQEGNQQAAYRWFVRLLFSANEPIDSSLLDEPDIQTMLNVIREHDPDLSRIRGLIGSEPSLQYRVDAIRALMKHQKGDLSAINEEAGRILERFSNRDKTTAEFAWIGRALLRSDDRQAIELGLKFHRIDPASLEPPELLGLPPYASFNNHVRDEELSLAAAAHFRLGQTDLAKKAILAEISSEELTEEWATEATRSAVLLMKIGRPWDGFVLNARSTIVLRGFGDNLEEKPQWEIGEECLRELIGKKMNTVVAALIQELRKTEPNLKTFIIAFVHPQDRWSDYSMPFGYGGDPVPESWSSGMTNLLPMLIRHIKSGDKVDDVVSLIRERLKSAPEDSLELRLLMQLLESPGQGARKKLLNDVLKNFSVNAEKVDKVGSREAQLELLKSDIALQVLLDNLNADLDDDLVLELGLSLYEVEKSLRRENRARFVLQQLASSAAIGERLASRIHLIVSPASRLDIADCYVELQQEEQCLGILSQFWVGDVKDVAEHLEQIGQLYESLDKIDLLCDGLLKLPLNGDDKDGDIHEAVYRRFNNGPYREALGTRLTQKVIDVLKKYRQSDEAFLQSVLNLHESADTYENMFKALLSVETPGLVYAYAAYVINLAENTGRLAEMKQQVVEQIKRENAPDKTRQAWKAILGALLIRQKETNSGLAQLRPLITGSRLSPDDSMLTFVYERLREMESKEAKKLLYDSLLSNQGFAGRDELAWLEKDLGMTEQAAKRVNREFNLAMSNQSDPFAAGLYPAQSESIKLLMQLGRAHQTADVMATKAGTALAATHRSVRTWSDFEVEELKPEHLRPLIGHFRAALRAQNPLAARFLLAIQVRPQHVHRLFENRLKNQLACQVFMQAKKDRSLNDLVRGLQAASKLDPDQIRWPTLQLVAQTIRDGSVPSDLASQLVERLQKSDDALMTLDARLATIWVLARHEQPLSVVRPLLVLALRRSTGFLNGDEAVVLGAMAAEKTKDFKQYFDIVRGQRPLPNVAEVLNRWEKKRLFKECAKLLDVARSNHAAEYYETLEAFIAVYDKVGRLNEFLKNYSRDADPNVAVDELWFHDLANAQSEFSVSDGIYGFASDFYKHHATLDTLAVHRMRNAIKHRQLSSLRQICKSLLVRRPGAIGSSDVLMCLAQIPVNKEWQEFLDGIIDEELKGPKGVAIGRVLKDFLAVQTGNVQAFKRFHKDLQESPELSFLATPLLDELCIAFARFSDANSLKELGEWLKQRRLHSGAFSLDLALAIMMTRNGDPQGEAFWKRLESRSKHTNFNGELHENFWRVAEARLRINQSISALRLFGTIAGYSSYLSKAQSAVLQLKVAELVLSLVQEKHGALLEMLKHAIQNDVWEDIDLFLVSNTAPWNEDDRRLLDALRPKNDVRFASLLELTLLRANEEARREVSQLLEAKIDRLRKQPELRNNGQAVWTTFALVAERVNGKLTGQRAEKILELDERHYRRDNNEKFVVFRLISKLDLKNKRRLTRIRISAGGGDSVHFEEAIKQLRMSARRAEKADE